MPAKPTRIADTRVASSDDLASAKLLLQDIALQTLDKNLVEAEAEISIAEIKTVAEEKTGPIRERIQANQDRLAKFITANPGLFLKPRAVKTVHGEFGLRTVTDLVVDDDDALIDWLLSNGHDQAVQVIRKAVKTAVRELIEQGHPVPGAAVRTGDVAFVKVSKTWLDQEASNVRAG